ncbi:sulfotransferase domain-containing protein [Enterococcus lemanii]|uniref:Sulfotransferase domain-containing protein n=1 Tax=Enterococcus lemanii TaxID=1159752 RepID=A0ABV9MRR1_9ENTE|nr:sulfotransferase domain-containing protein [Enterococcus lemanii]MBM7709068.1 hypothetical protein [Enterococcus lemanii]
MSKKKQLNVAVTGYVGTGSSAVIDLLKEFDNIGIATSSEGPYEHVPFYVDNGLFDLGNILMNNNHPLRSDTAISSFVESMEWLNNNDFGWFGSYKKKYGDSFMNNTMKFIESISTEITGTTYSHYKNVRFSVLKLFLQAGAKFFYKRPIYKWGREYVYDKKKMYFSMPNQKEFLAAAKQYTNNYFKMCSDEEKEIMVYDHLIWPQQAELINDYFDKNFKVIIVTRDARDLFNLNKNYWYAPPISNGSPLFPTDVQDFIDYWKRNLSKKIENENILYVNFEDLVYNYDSTVDTIMGFLEINSNNHVNKRYYFKPEKSEKNTQTYYIDSKWYRESELILSSIPEYTYNFPYRNDTSKKEMFDVI